MTYWDGLLTQTYTRTPVTVANTNTDSWGLGDAVLGNAVTNQVCLFNPSETIRVDNEGRVVTSGPFLFVPANSALNVGDRVSSVSGGGSSLDPGPLTVDTIENLTLGAEILVRRAKLRRGVAK